MDGSHEIETVEVTECCGSWTVKEFSALCKAEYESPGFFLGADGDDWYMTMWPFGRTRAAINHVSVSLWCGGLRPQPVQCQVSVLQHGQLSHHTIPMRLNGQYSTFWDRLVLREDVLRGAGGLLTNGHFQLHIKLWPVGSAEPVCPHETQDGRQAAPSKGCPLDPISLTFKRWHQDRVYADMTVKVGDQQFKIHKVLFASRSQVFDRMLRHDLSETNTGCVVLTDITPEVFIHLDEYMYTGRVVDLEEFASDLLYAAEKYELEGLKGMCEEALIATISKDTALDYLTLADLYTVSKLKKAALDFMKQLGQAVTYWEGWMTFITEQPKLATEVFRYILPSKISK